MPHEGRLVNGAEVVSVDGELRLAGGHCKDCDARIFPADAMCPFCLSTEVAKVPLSKTGTLYSFTVIHVAPKVWEVPYAIGYVDLPEGVRVFAKLAHADVARWKLDQEVRVRVEESADEASDKANPQYQYFFDAV
jgi:uncharacterized OB-fold protein